MVVRPSESPPCSLGVAKTARRGMALLVVLVLTVLLAIAAYEFTFYMESQYRASRAHEEQTQARFAALSGLEVAAAMLELPPANRNEHGGISDNSELFASIATESLGELTATNNSDAVERLWRCSLVSSAQDIVDSTAGGNSAAGRASEMNEALVRFGMVNESAKLHIPSLLKWDQEMPGHAEAVLMNLPGATSASVRAWLTSILQNVAGASQARSLSEKMQEAGSASSDPATSRNELKALWFGADLNRNYRIDPLEVQLFAHQDTSGSSSTGNSSNTPDGMLGDRSVENAASAGWSDYLSWRNGHRNRSYIGQARINLNQDDLQNLQRELLAVWPADRVNYVIAYRQFGSTNASSNSALQAESAGQWSPDVNQSAGYTINSPLDLVDSFVSVSTGSAANESDSSVARKQLLASPFQSLAGDGGGGIHDLLDEATTESTPWIRGRIDISAAPRPVLLGIPGIDESLAQTIVSQRSNLATSPERLSTVAWLLDGGGVTLDQLRVLEPYIAGRSDVYSVQSVGFRDAASPVFRCTATIDASQRPARVLDFQTWHVWGSGFSTRELRGTDQR